MYAVVRSGGKQYKVAEGETLAVERLTADAGDDVELEPVLLVDGETVLATAEQLQDATVTATVIGEELGPKITGFRYKNKSNQRRRWGHRQHYHTIEIRSISKG